MSQANWDNYIETTAYTNVLAGMEVVRLVIPTMFSKCKKYIYLKTSDLEYEVGDYEGIKHQIAETRNKLIECYNILKAECSFEKIERLYLLQVDYITLCGLLSENPEEEFVFYPEAILDTINSI